MDQMIERMKKKKKESLMFWLIAFVVLAGGVALTALYGESNNVLMTIGVIMIVAGFILVAIALGKYSKTKSIFKNELLPQVFEEAIPGTSYDPKNGLSKDIVYATEFLKKADRFHSEDFLSGEIEDVHFMSSDVRLEERRVRHTKNGTQVTYVPYFIGRVFHFNFNKSFKGFLQVLETGRPLSRRKFEEVHMESIDFNDKFDIYSTDAHSAFYVLTPDIMEAIQKLERRHPGRISMSFYDNQLFIAINNNKNTFELNFFKRIDIEMLKEFKADLLVIRDFIETLKLNTKIFK